MAHSNKLCIAHFYALLIAAALCGSVYAQNAVLGKTISIPNSGSCARMRLGDLNGDGRLDMLMVQPTPETPSEVQMLTAFDGCTGEKLWQVGTDNGLTGTDRDEPAQIWDINNDGKNEVVAVMNTKILFLNGATGATLKSIPMPAGYETLHDYVTFANFSGGPAAQEIVLKDRYSKAIAIDTNGKVLWTYSGITGHCPWPCDIDGDGKDELFVGYSCIMANGQPKYPAPINVDHPDCIYVGDVDGDPSNGLEVVYGLATNPSTRCVNIKSGKIVWTNSDRKESQQIILADFRKDLPGLEVYGMDRVNRTDEDALFIVNGQGTQTWEETPDKSGWLTAIKLIHNWDGTHTPMCLAHKRGGGVMPEVRDGTGKILCHLGTDGNAIVGDLAGDDKEEVAVYSTTTVNIYASSQLDYTLPAPTPGKPFKQTKVYGLYSRYGSGDVMESATAATVKQAASTSPIARQGSMRKVTGNRLILGELAAGKSAVVTVFDMSGKQVYKTTVKQKIVDITGQTGMAESVYLAKVLYE
jgi:outer membrane protein assembly factor BamB